MKYIIRIFLLLVVMFSHAYSQTTANEYIEMVKSNIRNDVDKYLILVPSNSGELLIQKIIGFSQDDMFFILSNNIPSNIKIMNIKYIKSLKGNIYFDHEVYKEKLLSSIGNQDNIINSVSESGKSLKLFRKLYYTGASLNLLGSILIIGNISTELGIIVLSGGSVIILVSFYFIGEAGEYLLNIKEQK